MAKINARGAREVARWEAVRSHEADEFGPAGTTRFLFLLRSDGKVLRRLADTSSGLSGGYSIFASFKPTDNKTETGRKLTAQELIDLRKRRVERMLTNKGYRWTAQAVRV